MTGLRVLRDEMTKAGYRADAIVTDYVFSDILSAGADSRSVALAAFSDTPPSYRSAAIAAEESGGRDAAAIVGEYRSLGAPLLFVIDDAALLVTGWQVRAEGAPSLIFRSRLADLPSLFAAHRDEWAPLAIHRAKSIGQFDRRYQLDFVDVGLLPAIEGETQVKLGRLLEATLAETLRARHGPTGEAIVDDRSMFRTTFRLLAAKVLNDRGHELASQWNPDDIDSVLDTISGYYQLPRFPQERAPEHRAIFAAAWDRLRDGINFRNISADDLAFVYENTLVTPETRRYFGTHSTPRQLAEYMVGHLELWRHEPSQLRIYEPFAGAALFLVAALRQLRDLLPPNLTDATRHKFLVDLIAGDEIDAFAREVATLSLILADYPNANGWNIGEIDLLADQVLAGRLSGANVVLCNPPFSAFSPEEQSRYPDLAARSVTKSGAILNVVLDRCPMALGFILPRAFIDERQFRDQRKRVEALYRDIELISLPEGTFRTSGVEASVIVARSPRDEDLGRPISLTSTVVSRRLRDEFLRLGTSVISRTKSRMASIHPDGDLWIRELDALWHYLADYPRLGAMFAIHPGIEWQSDQRQATSVEPKPGYRLGLHKANAVHPFYLEKPVWLDTRAERLLYKAVELPWDQPKIITNAVRLARGPWRIAAAVDSDGRVCSQQLFGCWLKSECPDALQTWAAVLNGPVANAFVAVHSPANRIRVSTMRSLPVPAFPPTNIGPLIEEYRSLFSSINFHLGPDMEERASALLNLIDALVLKAYDLPPRLERELLEYFRAAHRPTLHPWRHWLPDDFGPALPLSEYLSGEYAKMAGDWVLDIFTPLPPEEAALLRDYFDPAEQP